MERTIRWAERCRRPAPALGPGTVRHRAGGVDPGLVNAAPAGLLPLDFPGYAVGGLSVGEKPPN